MYALKSDPFYGVLARYPACVLDFCLLRDDAPYRGAPSHRAALESAMRRLSMTDEGDGALSLWEYDVGRARARRIDARTLLAPPDRPLWHTETLWDGSTITVFDRPTGGGAIPYRQAFLCPPHGSGYTGADFDALNRALFPRGTERLDVLEWTTDWSDYFDDGHEWWGCGCWSVYDAAAERYAVILASATD